jgi:hypothetical protein
VERIPTPMSFIIQVLHLSRLHAADHFHFVTRLRQHVPSTFEIEKKSLPSIGLLASALVALVYWVMVIVSRAVG